MRRHPGYTVFLILMVLICLCGIALLIWGAATQQPLPRLRPLVAPPRVHHG